MQKPNELEEKLARLARMLEQEGLDGAVLSTQANFAWFTCGGDNHVATASDTGVAHAVVTRDKAWIICENIEADRIRDEEVGKLGLPVEPYNWWEGKQKETIESLIGSTNYGSDTGLFGSRNVEPALAPFRYSLLPEEIERYRWVAERTATHMDWACRQIRPGMTEHEIAGILNEPIIACGMVPQVTLIAADERIAKYRHPIPTEKAVERYVMVVTGTKRWGLVVSMSRMVHFGRIPDELRRKHLVCAQVDATFIHDTRPGADVAGIFEQAVKAYAEAGFPEEWKLHHQGGSTGYKGRDYRGSLSVKATVQPNQAFAWNPSITGTKTEDTIIALPERTEIISEIPGWPMVEVTVGGEKILRPDILER